MTLTYEKKIHKLIKGTKERSKNGNTRIYFYIYLYTKRTVVDSTSHNKGLFLASNKVRHKADKPSLKTFSSIRNIYFSLLLMNEINSTKISNIQTYFLFDNSANK